MFIYLNALFVGLLIVSNILGVKLFSIGEFILPAAVIVYVVTFIITDVIGEVYGKNAARKTVQAGFFTQVIVMIFIFIAIELPAAPAFGSQAEFETILGGSFRVMLASLLSYIASQHLDVSLFQRLKAKHGKNKLWLRNNVSTMTSQLVDTTIFITIAFWGTVPFTVLLGMVATQYVFKLIVALVDTPIVYLLVKMARKTKQEQTNMEVVRPS
ncbi:putative integral membrane protein (TIGR00697 family) [Virgibacillus natechei]|uniref:Probable queuosine precursor transporter n=1 Tax=Virgibacillus natechei TaxID=1216297 RepID=A0ABS4IIB6_9BACI|nr:queuosine precursor transporter [Virgibacillus natechei]MBP1970708.1 putative integral membrane protein (TIGR00697 family) [Virgibacillus natechei]UZD12048.1 queuosine precursor transporter [Virgibacillus natechei]